MPFYKSNDPFLTVTIIAILAATLKFLMEGIDVKFFGHSLSVSHVDATVYAAFLTPILSAHGYMSVKGTKKSIPGKVDAPNE